MLSFPVRGEETKTSEKTSALEEITVTARRTEESLQTVPVAVSALTAADINDLQITNFSDVGQTVPNLNIQTQFGSGSAPQFFLRGQASGSLSFEVDSRIGLYIDGVYLGRSAAAAFDLAALCQLEVLRGPQGTLFGRNSTGGAINLRTCAPSDDFGGEAEVTIGDYAERRFKASMDTGLVNGFAAKLTYLHSQHDGYVNNSASGDKLYFTSPFGTVEAADDFGWESQDAYGVSIRYTGIDKLVADYRFDYTDKKNTQLGVQLLGFTDPGVEGIFAISGGIPASTKRRDSLPLDFTGYGKLEVMGNALTLDYEINDVLRVKNIASYRTSYENTGGNDIDGNALNATIFGMPETRFAWISSLSTRTQRQTSDELQLLGTHERLSWILGLFYFQENGNWDGPVFIGAPFPSDTKLTPGNLSAFVPSDYYAGSHVFIKNESKAAYGHAEYTITDALNVSAGLRQTWDDREEFIKQLGAYPPDTKFTTDFSYTDWDVSVNYEVLPDINTYAKVNTGHLSGGVLGGLKFKEESIISYEVGAKTQFFDNRLRFNLAAFHSDVKNLQTLTFTPETGTIIINTGKPDQNGVEVEFTALLAEGLKVDGSYGYLDVNLDTNMRSLAPENTAYLGVQYDFPRFFDLGLIVARVDASWHDDTYGLVCPAGSTTTPGGCINLGAANKQLDNAVVQKANTQLSARLSLTDIPIGANTTGRISVWGRNLLDTDELEFPRDLGNGTVVGTFQVPRTYGVDVSFKF